MAGSRALQVMPLQVKSLMDKGLTHHVACDNVCEDIIYKSFEGSALKMKNWKKFISVAMTMLIALGMLTGCGAGGDQQSAASVGSTGQAEEAAAPIDLNVAALKGPTGMGLVKMMNDADRGETLSNNYTFTMAASADEITPKLIQGDIDIACVPANLASVLYNKTDGNVQVLAINTYGILYIVDNGDTVNSAADLKGKTIYASGKGATPEYALRYVLSQNGIDPDKDVTIEWKSEHAECVSAIASSEGAVALLPQPFVTTAQMKNDSIRTALDLTEEWDKLGADSSMVTGVAVIRKEVADANPGAVENFINEYNSSVDWVNANVSDAAALIENYDIVKAAVAEKAIPACHIVCVTGEAMKSELSGYLNVLAEQAPEAVGGKLPDDDFYFGA